MKTKKILFTLSLLIISTLTLTGCLNQDNKQTQDQQSQQVANQNNDNSENSLSDDKQTLEQLMKSNKAQSCKWSLKNEQGNADGELYMDTNGNSYTVMNFKDEDMNMTIYSIMKDEYVYAWNDQSKTGTKFKYTDFQNQDTNTSDQDFIEQYQQLSDKSLEVSCDSWNVNDNKFNPPSDIEFIDMTEMMQNLEQQGDQLQEDLCKMCESLPAEAKTECLQSCQ